MQQIPVQQAFGSPQKTRCNHAPRGCRWQGFAGSDFENHLRFCPFDQMKEYLDEKDRQIQELRQQVQQFHKVVSSMKSEGMYHLNLEGHTSIVVSLAVVNKTLFSGSMDGTLKVWNLDTFTVQREASLGPVFAIKIVNTFMFSGHLNCIKVWDLQTFECKSTLTGHNGNVKAICVMNDILFSGSSDCSIKVWNLQTSQCLHTLSGAHNGEIRDLLAITDPQGAMKFLLSSGDDGTIKVWNKSFSCEKILTGHKGAIRAIAKSGDVIFSGSDDTYIKLWNAQNFTEISMIPALIGVHSLAVSHASNPPTLISGHRDGVIKLWNLANITAPECQMLLSAHTEPVRALLVEGNIFISGGYDKTIKIWYPQHQRLYFNFNK